MGALVGGPFAGRTALTESAPDAFNFALIEGGVLRVARYERGDDGNHHYVEADAA